MSEQEWNALRAAALVDAENVLTSLDFIPCGWRGDFYDCPKCGLLSRILERVLGWQDELINTAA